MANFSKNASFFSPLPPSRCGIASYAAEHLLSLEADGVRVNRISMLKDSEADVYLNLKSVRSCLKALCQSSDQKSNDLVVHYADNLFFPRRAEGIFSRRICYFLQALLLHRLAKQSSKSLVVIHEIPTVTDLSWINNWTRHFALGTFDEIAFHTLTMRNDFMHRFPKIPTYKTSVVKHTQFMQPHYRGTRVEARTELGIKSAGVIFLCIGFLHHSKGFHDAIHAFSMVPQPSSSAQLHIVGSAPGKQPEAQSYAKELEALGANTANVFSHQQYLNDDAFDRWLAAADVVILPYLGVASSGVGARASLYGTDVIIRNLPNFTEQLPDAETFTTTAELAELFKKRMADSHAL